MGETDDGGLAMRVRDGRLVFLAPKSTSAAALEFAGLAEADLLAELGDGPA